MLPSGDLVDAWRRHRAIGRCNAVGAFARIDGVPSVDNRGRIEIGRGLALSSIPVRSHLATGPSGTLRIGDGVRIAHGVSITAYAEVIVEDDVALAPFVIILDTDFHEVHDRASPGIARPVRIGRGARLGAGVVVLRGAVIGEGAVIAPNSVVSRYLPPYSRAAGVPARLVR